MIKKKKIILFLLIIISIVIFDVFRLTPFAKLVSYSSLILSTIGHFIFFLKPQFFPKTFKFWYNLGLLTMIISITTCQLYYGQSLVSGFVANINFYNIGLVSLFWHLFIKYKIFVDKLFYLLSKTGWISLISISFIVVTGYVYINESELTGKIIEIHGGKLSKDLVNFIALYFFSIFIYKNKTKYLFLTILFFAINHIYEVQRFSLVVSIAVIFFGFFRSKNKRANLKLILLGFISLPIIYFYISNSTVGNNFKDRFTEAFKIFSEEDEKNVDDPSVAVRFLEAQYALEKYIARPYFGNGLYRASESKKVIGDRHFYVSDIGLFGVLYSFGIFGILIYLLQLKFLLKIIKLKNLNNFQYTIMLAFFNLMLYSLLTGQSIFFYKNFMFFICLFYLSSSIYPKKNYVKN